MSAERNAGSSASAELARRVRVHAALADPGRLQLIDVLALTDASPTELEQALGMASNLLAHHLGVLERAGVVSRHRSEADRRRSYVQLVAASLEGLLPTGVQPVTRVVFVCTANTARSQLAAALWARACDIPATSAGTHPGEVVARGALHTAARHGLDLPETRPRHLAEVVTAHDLVVTVCDHAHEELAARRDLGAGAAPARRLHWSVADPVPTGDPAAFDTAYNDLAGRVTQLATRLAAS